MVQEAGSVVNMMTVDVEDYFHVSAFRGVVRREEWDAFESRVERNTSRLLDLFGAHGVTATFFVLGWVAERHPRLVRRIAEAGHELGAHSYDHRLVYDMTPDSFRADLRMTRALIEEASGRPVMGYRAPSFSITARSLWAYDVLAEEGFRFSASVFPIHHDLYGMPSAPRRPHWVRVGRSAGREEDAGAPGVEAGPPAAILEVPCSTIRIGSINAPVGGGGYLRLLPMAWTRWGIERLNRAERLPAMVYVHPWECDPDQPRISAPWRSRIRHYRNLAKTERRLRGLLRRFTFDAVSGVARRAAGPSPGRAAW